MGLIAAVFVVLLANMMMDLLLEKQKGRRITPKMWKTALLIPAGISGLFLCVAWFFKANPKIAHAPLSPWFFLVLLGLIVGFPFVMEVWNLCEQKRKTGASKLKIEDDFVMGIGFVALLLTGALWARFDFSAWFLPFVLASMWIMLVAFWVLSTKTVAFLVDKTLPRNPNEK